MIKINLGQAGSVCGHVWQAGRPSKRAHTYVYAREQIDFVSFSKRNTRILKNIKKFMIIISNLSNFIVF